MKALAASLTGLGLAIGVAGATAASPAQLTLTARPDIAKPADWITFSGTLSTGEAGESITVETKECGGYGYHILAGAQTTEGGAWSARQFVLSPGSFRARWQDTVSNVTVVRMRADVRINRLPRSTKVQVSVGSRYQNMHGRLAELQRQAASGAWVRVSRARLKRAGYGFTEAIFTVRRRGLRLRAFLPRTSAAPCYLAGASATVTS